MYITIYGGIMYKGPIAQIDEENKNGIGISGSDTFDYSKYSFKDLKERGKKIVEDLNNLNEQLKDARENSSKDVYRLELSIGEKKRELESINYALNEKRGDDEEEYDNKIEEEDKEDNAELNDTDKKTDLKDSQKKSELESSVEDKKEPTLKPKSSTPPKVEPKTPTPVDDKKSTATPTKDKSKEEDEKLEEENLGPYAFSRNDRKELVSMFSAEYLNLVRELEILKNQINIDESRGETETEEYDSRIKKRRDLESFIGMKAFSVIANCLEQFEGVDENGKKLKETKTDGATITRGEAITAKFTNFRNAIRNYNTSIFEKDKKEAVTNFINSLGDFANSVIKVGDGEIVLKDLIENNFEYIKDFIVRNKLDGNFYEVGDKVVGFIRDKGVDLQYLNNMINMQYKLNANDKSYGPFTLDYMKNIYYRREENLKLARFNEFIKNKLKKNEEITKDNTKTITLGTVGVGGAAAIAAAPIFPVALIIALVSYCSYANKDKNPMGKFVSNAKDLGLKAIEKIDENCRAFADKIRNDRKAFNEENISTLMKENREQVSEMVKALENTGINKLDNALSTEQLKYLNNFMNFYRQYTEDKPELASNFDNSNRSVLLPLKNVNELVSSQSLTNEQKLIKRRKASARQNEQDEHSSSTASIPIHS